MPLAYSYKRFSSQQQAAGDSQRRQEQIYANLCEKHGLTPATAYFDEGKSAWRGKKQKDLEKFVEHVKSGEVSPGSWFIVESLDRLSRKKFSHIYDLLREILRAKITIATSNPERVFNEESINDTFAILEIAMIAARANEESQIKSERVRAAWHNKLDKAKRTKEVATKRGPSWLDIEDGKWVKNPAKVKVIKRIFRLCIDKGMGSKAIAKTLNKDKTPPFKGKQWVGSFVHTLLTGRNLLGELESKIGVIPGYYPAIVSEEDFQIVQASVKKRKWKGGRVGPKVSNLFAGIAFDVETQSSMVFHDNGVQPPRWKAMAWIDRRKQGRAVSFPYAIFEKAFLELTQELTIDDVGTSPAVSEDEIREIEGKIARLELQIDGVKTKLENLEIGPEGMDVLNNLSNKRKSLAVELETVKAGKYAANNSHSLNESQSLLDKLKSASPEELVEIRFGLRQQIRNLVQRIDVRIERKSSLFDLYALIRFHSGEVRTIILRVRQGKLVAAGYDHKKWKDKYPGKSIVLYNIDMGDGTFEDEYLTEDQLMKAGFTLDSFMGFKS